MDSEYTWIYMDIKKERVSELVLGHPSHAKDHNKPFSSKGQLYGGLCAHGAHQFQGLNLTDVLNWPADLG